LDEANSKSRLDISGAIVAAKSFVERFRNHL